MLDADWGYAGAPLQPGQHHVRQTKMNRFMPYDPGVLPSAPSPLGGETITFCVEGLPPYKDEHFSIRNNRHKIHSRFVVLRKVAINAMAGRAPYLGALRMDFVMYATELEKNRTLTDYMGGIMDTLDGSHGVEFTYLPIVYEDDCQVCDGETKFKQNSKTYYEITIRFLQESINGEHGA